LLLKPGDHIKQKALALAYDASGVVSVQVYTIGDGEAMSGLLIAGCRQVGEAVFLVLLLVLLLD
jgi:hypothetical protein